MRLMNSICVVIAKLVEDGFDFGVVLGGNQLTNGTLQAGRASLCKSRISTDEGHPRKGQCREKTEDWPADPGAKAISSTDWQSGGKR